ncbi:hypothetical protein NDU88_009671 [Pleurodeles waltl]|uniref:Uncharacterized protein n=1 Tax=Pleurodeles waltl TaxID=8319 RepID=A0AAV7QV77_PLEWA|nr:hypothetical protein NDU88_009671 [Pleurodeles waltl]
MQSRMVPEALHFVLLSLRPTPAWILYGPLFSQWLLGTSYLQRDDRAWVCGSEWGHPGSEPPLLPGSAPREFGFAAEEVRKAWESSVSTIGMAGMPLPRISLNLGEKGEGARVARTKRPNGEMATGTRRPTPTLGKTTGKLSTGTSKEANSSAPPLSSLGGIDTQSILSGKLGADCEGKTHPDDVSKEKDSLLNCPQASEVLDAPEIKLPEGVKDPSRSLEYAEIHTLPGGNVQTRFEEQEIYISSQTSQGRVTSPLMGGAGNLTHTAQKLGSGLEATGAKEKGPDWPKDGGDKFYSLTEDSDYTNSEQGSSETGASISSESATFLSLAESTVRQQRRKTKGRAPIRDGVEPSTQTRKALKWDYSGMNLVSTAVVHSLEAQANMKKGGDALLCSLVPSTGARHTDSEILQSIYYSIKELQTETRAESRRARMATKHLQGTVHKVVKSCRN